MVSRKKSVKVFAHTRTDGNQPLLLFPNKYRTLDCGEGTPGVYARVSEGYHWIRSIICQFSIAPPPYMSCDSGIGVNVTLSAPNTNLESPKVPILLKHEIGADGYFYENGTQENRSEKIVVSSVMFAHVMEFAYKVLF